MKIILINILWFLGFGIEEESCYFDGKRKIRKAVYWRRFPWSEYYRMFFFLYTPWKLSK